MQNVADIRVERAEQDIRTLRKTQNRVLDRFERFQTTLNETRDIAADNRRRLERVEDRLELVEEVLLENRKLILENRERLERVEKRLGVVEEVVLENRALIEQNGAAIRENRAILLSIAEHYGLTWDVPGRDDQSD